MLLVGTIIGNRRKQFSKKELILGVGKMIFCLVETVFFDQRYFSVNGNHDWNQGKQFSKKKLILASRQLVFKLVETIFFSTVSETPASFLPV